MKPGAVLVGIYIGVATMENNMEISKNDNNNNNNKNENNNNKKLPHDAAILLLGIYLKENEITVSERNLYSQCSLQHYLQ